MTTQACAVDKCPISVSKVAKAGNRVVFDEDEGNYIEDKHTKESIWITENQGMYSIKMWIQKEKSPFSFAQDFEPQAAASDHAYKPRA